MPVVVASPLSVKLNTVLTAPIKLTLAFSMMKRLTEYKPVMVKIPVSRSGMCNLVVRKPDTAPAAAPPAKPSNVAAIGPTPDTIAWAVIAAPSGKLPSAVISAMSKIRNVRYTPMAMTDHNNPWAILDVTISITKPLFKNARLFCLFQHRFSQPKLLHPFGIGD